ncbi:hypothetical protein ACFQ88_02230 [Paenibacillus sp. NPDC056579]|uniref:hypothetical protein n=1 Tax=unclassified Paenibacillus TaxID=185978 RepID=UPI001EF81340|nr:hypothetical protein [Paenibacillus sp. H1-7]ULL15858.1 hypothetical protein DVH26_16230 [Paenibacillus sp. H1-7]
MPFVLKHKQTSQLYTCNLINVYRLPYYGTKFWDFEDDAATSYIPFLESKGQPVDEWELLELSENQLKLCNVKLKNDPQLILLWDAETQKARVSTSPSEP